MDFILLKNKILPRNNIINHGIQKLDITNDITLLFNAESLFSSGNNDQTIYIIGDIVLNEKQTKITTSLRNILNDFTIEKLKKTGGHFYCFRVLKNTGTVEVYSSFLNILPIFYSTKENIISSSARWIKILGHYNNYNISGQFILEKLFFNYPLFDSSIFENIKLIPAHSYFTINKCGISIKSYPDISEWFVDKPLLWGKNKDYLTDLFLSRLTKYFPEEKYYISFTGGFDGRTLVSGALNLNKSFSTYSFGTHTSEDVIIPAAHAQKLGISYNPFFLDDNNYLNESFNDGLEFVENTDGMANFARAHYVYAVKRISQKSRYILSGNFGSELFRAFHNTGVVVSPLMYRLFAEKDFNKILSDILSQPELQVLNGDYFKKDIKYFIVRLKEEHVKIHALGNINELFYRYIFEEVFRKYFGAEIKMQANYLLHRTPYLDPVFVKEILNTEIAGVYSRFYEGNPVKRFKGQLFYAEFIKKTNKVLYNLITGKGYAPRDLLVKTGCFRIVKAFYIKKRKKSLSEDPFGVDKSLYQHKNKFREIKDPFGLFNLENTWKHFNKQGWENNIFINVYSLLHLINKYG